MTTTISAVDELRPLLEHRARWCISIFLPTHRRGPEIRQAAIRLKNLLHEAEVGLSERGVRQAEIEELLAPARVRLTSHEFWRLQSDGLALFLAPDFRREHRLPLEFDEHVTVAEEFEIRPLLPLLAGNGRFFVLALSGAHNRLYEATRDSIVELPTPGVPESLDVALRFDDPQSQLQFRTGTSVTTPAGGRRAATFHGHGVGVDDARSNLLRYCQQIDRGLEPLLAGERAPMVLAAVDADRAVYREANSYRHLLERGVAGNPDRVEPLDLLRRAWPIAEPHFAAEIERALARFGDLSSSPRASTRPDEILTAAASGRVDTLFVDRDERLRGIFRADTGEVMLVADGTEDGTVRDLIELAARHTLTHAGTVYALNAGELPEGATAAAILRY